MRIPLVVFVRQVSTSRFRDNLFPLTRFRTPPSSSSSLVVVELKREMQFVHLSYLQQLSDLLEDKNKSQAARLGYIAKQIREKHVVHISGADTPKLTRCKACHGPITCDNVYVKTKKQFVKCPLCGTQLYIADMGKKNKEKEAS